MRGADAFKTAGSMTGARMASVFSSGGVVSTTALRPLPLPQTHQRCPRDSHHQLISVGMEGADTVDLGVQPGLRGEGTPNGSGLTLGLVPAQRTSSVVECSRRQCVAGATELFDPCGLRGVRWVMYDGW